MKTIGFDKAEPGGDRSACAIKGTDFLMELPEVSDPSAWMVFTYKNLIIAGHPEIGPALIKEHTYESLEQTD